MSKILVLVPIPLSQEGLSRREAQAAELTVSEGIEFVFRCVAIGPDNFDSAHDTMLADIALVEAGEHAQADGFAGVCVDTMSDSGVTVLRSLLDIPVVGPARISFLTALMLGYRFSILTLCEPWAPGYPPILRDMAITDKCVSIRWPTEVEPDLERLLEGKADVLRKLLDAGFRCVDDGADVICLGSTTMHAAHPHLSAELPVPVINPGPLSYKVIELMLALGLRQSRIAYPLPLTPKVDLIHAMVGAGRSAL